MRRFRTSREESTSRGVLMTTQSYSVRTPRVVGDDGAETIRRVVDVLACVVLLVLLVVPLLLIILAIRLEGSGPALFRQERVGLRGQRFTLLKFRTMFQGVDDRALRDLIARELRGEDTVDGGSSKLNNDRRITRVGSLLRRTSLDELPQLFNVLRGDMTLVGPRPCLGWEVEMSLRSSGRASPSGPARPDCKPSLHGKCNRGYIAARAVGDSPRGVGVAVLS